MRHAAQISDIWRLCRCAPLSNPHAPVLSVLRHGARSCWHPYGGGVPLVTLRIGMRVSAVLSAPMHHTRITPPCSWVMGTGALDVDTAVALKMANGHAFP